MRKYMNIITEAEIDQNSAPPEYEEKDREHYDALEKTGFFGNQASGCILMAKSTGRIMLVLRSAAVLEPHHWGNLGGAHGADERPVEAAKREVYEETGYTGQVSMVPLMVFKKDSFRYSNFLGIVDEEFTPNLGWEADRFVWVHVGHWPRPLHFGMEALFSDEESMRTIRHYAHMFSNGDELSEDVDLEKAIDAAKDQIKDIADGKGFDGGEVETDQTDNPDEKTSDHEEKRNSLAPISSKGSVGSV